MWKSDLSQPGGNFGVALRSPRIANKGNNRGNQAAITKANLVNRLSNWFDWRTKGGGSGKKLKDSGQQLHYGSVNVQVLDYDYQYMDPQWERIGNSICDTAGRVAGTTPVILTSLTSDELAVTIRTKKRVKKGDKEIMGSPRRKDALRRSTVKLEARGAW